MVPQQNVTEIGIIIYRLQNKIKGCCWIIAFCHNYTAELFIPNFSYLKYWASKALGSICHCSCCFHFCVMPFMFSSHRKYLLCPSHLVLHEVFYYNDVATLKSRINASPRSTIQRGLANPYVYLQVRRHLWFITCTLIVAASFYNWPIKLTIAIPLLPAYIYVMIVFCFKVAWNPVLHVCSANFGRSPGIRRMLSAPSKKSKYRLFHRKYEILICHLPMSASEQYAYRFEINNYN